MPVATTHRARYSLLTLHLPGVEETVAGVLLEDVAADQLYIRLRRDWDEIVGEEDADESEVLSALEYDLTSKARESGAAVLLDYLESTLSNVVRISDRREIVVDDFERTLGRLYREHVASNVREFVTHLPRYSLAVAAGPFLENREVNSEPDGWEEAPAPLRLSRDMFVARIQGRSMEPLIFDGALCVFRRGVTGSRQGRLVLVEALGGGANDRYTVKRYRSEKIQKPDGTWSHERIILEPLNPEFEAWDLDPEEERYRILAEFVQVLD
ncbi:MAG TPA: S24 family peptidase [Bryobacteraceae bacterium]|nr:S24 family peptidase [Bryobacteraceae bacterium]